MLYLWNNIHTFHGAVLQMRRNINKFHLEPSSLRQLQDTHSLSGIYQTVPLSEHGVFTHSCRHLPSPFYVQPVIASGSEIDSCVVHLLQGVIIMLIFQSGKKKINAKGLFTADKGD